MPLVSFRTMSMLLNFSKLSFLVYKMGVRILLRGWKQVLSETMVARAWHTTSVYVLQKHNTGWLPSYHRIPGLTDMSLGAWATEWMVTEGERLGTKDSRQRGPWGTWVLLQQPQGTGWGRWKLHFQGTAYQNTSLTAPLRETLPPPHQASGRCPPTKYNDLPSEADTCLALLFAGGRCPMPWGQWP